MQGEMRARTHGIYAWICSLSFCKIIKTKRISNPTAWFIILYCPIIDETQYLVWEEKNHSAVYFQLSCAWVLNRIFNRNLSFLNLIFTTCAETSLPLPSWCNVFSFTTHCSLSFYTASWWDAFSFGHISFDGTVLQLNILF